MDDQRQGVPSRTFLPQLGVGPTADQFAPFAPEKVKAMLTKRLEQRIVKPTHLPVPRCDNDILGQHRGVAGHNNSCYFDSTMMLLALFTQFDGIYSQEALDRSELLRIILFEVVIPLRTRMFVSRDVIAMLRYCLANQTRNQNYLGSIMDFDEFINDLMQTIDTRTVCDIRHDDSMDAKFTFPISADKPFKSLQAGLDDCLRARTVTVEKPPSAFFVRVRPAFRVCPLALPQMVLNVFGELYDLSAILCIETAHYMCFLRFPNGEWVFFDSMQGFDNGHRIPTMTRVPKFEDYIGSGCDERLLLVKSYGREGETKHSFHDLVTQYAYTFLYTRNTVSAQARQLYQANAPQLAAAGGGTAGGGAAAVSRQHPQQKPSAGGGAAAVSAKPAQSSRKPSAGGGGAAAVSHRHPLSFEHAQHQVVVEPQTWQDKLQSLFSNIFVANLETTMLLPSNKYRVTDYDIANNLCLLSSVAFDVQLSFKNICKEFLFASPCITHLDFTGMHNIVASFLIGKKMFRCTAVIFNDGHVVAFPELKNLQKGDQRRDQQRQAFHEAINSHFQKKPRVSIDKMLFEKCV
jgi:hypothetical protein